MKVDFVSNLRPFCKTALHHTVNHQLHRLFLERIALILLPHSQNYSPVSSASLHLSYGDFTRCCGNILSFLGVAIALSVRALVLE